MWLTVELKESRQSGRFFFDQSRNRSDIPAQHELTALASDTQPHLRKFGPAWTSTSKPIHLGELEPCAIILKISTVCGHIGAGSPRTPAPFGCHVNRPRYFGAGHRFGHLIILGLLSSTSTVFWSAISSPTAATRVCGTDTPPMDAFVPSIHNVSIHLDE